MLAVFNWCQITWHLNRTRYKCSAGSQPVSYSDLDLLERGRGVPEEALRGEGGVPARPNLVSSLLQPVQPVLLKQLPALVPLL
jgi:hypothetical protein